MDERCPRCRQTNLNVARFCGQCGLSLEPGVEGKREAGRVRHPDPLVIPDGCERIINAADVYYRTESAWGGRRLSGTENIGVILYNVGYPLREVVLMVRGYDGEGSELFAVEQVVDELPRGDRVTVEIASYEIPSPPERLSVALVSAEFVQIE